jgi:peptidoglycan/LPS O-acetylase OafA/YrhL
MPTTKDATDVTLSSVHLDAVRGAAALVVLVGHNRDFYFSPVLGKPGEALPPPDGLTPTANSVPQGKGQITIGNEAVMIFFVLSGYLVGGGVLRALSRNTWSWRDYLIKRLTRLYVVLIPALLLGVALDFAGLYLHPSPTSIYAGPPGQTLLHDVADRLTLPVIAGNAVFLQGARVRTAGTNVSLWSLTNEFWYYIAFPVLLLALSKKKKLWLRCVYLLSFAGIGLLVGSDVSLLFLPWLLGALVSLIPLRIPQGPAKIAVSVLFLALPLVFEKVRRTSLPVIGVQWTVALYFVIVLYLLLHQTEATRSGVYRSMSGFFSRISYTAYLVHMPVAVFLCAYLNDPWRRWDKTPRGIAIFMGSNIGLVLFSYLFYLAFEANTDRVRKMLSHRLMRSKHLPTSVTQSG